MWKRLMQVGLAAVVAIIALAILIPSGNAIVLADVLEYIQSPSYTFSMTVQAGNASDTVRAMVLRPGRVRFEATMGVGTISTVMDLDERRSLLLFHQFKTAQYLADTEEPNNVGLAQLLKLCSSSVENLWNLQDGTEEDLGEKDIDGVTVRGFCVVSEDEYFRNETTIWAEIETARPVEVVIVSTARKQPHGELTWKLTNFDLDAELDESLFGLDVPAGYTLADQRRLEDVTSGEQASPEALRIVEALNLWKAGQADRAVETILAVQWDEPLEFAREPYIFGLTEKDIVMLKQADREAVMAELMPDCSHIRRMCFKLRDIAQEASDNKDYARAERHLEAMRQWGAVLTRDPEGTFIVQLVGIAMRKLALVRLKDLYEISDQPQKRIDVERKIQQVDAYHRDLVGSVKGK